MEGLTNLFYKKHPISKWDKWDKEYTLNETFLQIFQPFIQIFYKKFHLRCILCPICPILKFDVFYKIKLSTLPCVIPLFITPVQCHYFSHIYIFITGTNI